MCEHNSAPKIFLPYHHEIDYRMGFLLQNFTSTKIDLYTPGVSGLGYDFCIREGKIS